MIKTKLNKLRDNYCFRNILIPFILIIPLLCIAIPAIPSGTESIEMIRHFGQDEGSLVEFAGKTYSKGIIPLEYNVTYPQLYYYLAGIALFPYTFLKGINYQVIVITLRIFNILICITTIIFLYFFCLRFFKSIFVAILSSLLLSTSPEYISWIINSRPHLLEILFILITWFFCFRMAEQYRPKYFICAIIFMGLTTATKFGGIFIIPIVWFSYLYSRRKDNISETINYLKSKRPTIYFISSIIMIISLLIPIASFLLYPRIQKKLFIFGIRSFQDLLHSRNFRMVLLLAAVLFINALFWFLINKASSKYSIDTSLTKRHLYALLINKSFLVLSYIVMGAIAIFLICNPYYFLYPRSTIKEMGFEFAKAIMGTAYNPGLTTPILDKSGLLWFKMLFENSLLNIWFGLLFLFYLVLEVLNLKKSFIYSKTFLFQRFFLLLYSIYFFLFLVIFIKNKPHHYLLPIMIAMGILISFSMQEIIKNVSSKFIKRIFTVILFVILILGFYDRIIADFNVYEYFIDRPNDAAIAIGKWLENRYDKKVKIWKDTNEFYIPPKFKNFSFMHWQDNIANHISNINELKPDVLIITNELDESLGNVQKINQAIANNTLKNFNQIKIFNYEGPLALKKSKDGKTIGLYKKIYIFEKINN